MRNFAKDGDPKYRKPDPLHKGWHYIGDGKFHDPTLGSDAMRGRRWMIDPSAGNGKSFAKFQQGIRND